MGFDFLIITDCFYHYKNLYYFNRHNFFTLGVVNSTLDPWLVSYAIPGLLNNFFTQFFFLKILMTINQFAAKTKYEFYKKL